MKVMLSIKPEYVQRILNGEKTFEFRKRIFARSDVDTIVIYETSPTSKVVAEAQIGKTLEASPQEVWNSTYGSDGIGKKSFFNYFRGCEKAYAIGIGNVVKFDSPKPLKEYGVRCAPQSYVYIKS